VWQIVNVSAASLSYNLVGLLPSTKYQWRIATVCQTTPQIISSYTTIKGFTTKAAASAIILNKDGINSDDNSESITINNSDLRIYPNPATGVAILECKGNTRNLTVMLTDMNGKVLWRRNNIAQQNLDIPVKDLASGTYLILITGEKETNTLKLIKAY
jgi:hypothetical protein